MLKPKTQTLIPYILMLAAAAALLVWTITMWRGSFDSDEAIPALMAKHMMNGVGFPIYFYTHAYGGSLSSLIAVPFMMLFGVNVIAVRISVVVLLLIFYAMHAKTVHTAFGRNAALLSMIYLIVPGFSFFDFIVRFSAWYHVFLPVWMGTLLLYIHFPSSRKWQLLAILLSGVLIGLNLWTLPLTQLYVASLAILWLLQSQEWRQLHTRVRDWLWQKTGLAGEIPFVIAGVTAAITLPLLVWTRHLLPIFILAAAGILVVFWISRRKKQLITNGSLLVAGFLVGNFPQWGGWFFWGIRPVSAYLPRFPTQEMIGRLIHYIPTSFIGIRPPEQFFSRPVEEEIFALLVAPIAIAIVLYFFWRYRIQIRKLFSLSPLDSVDAMPVLVFILFIAAWLSMIGLPGIGEGSVRYMATAWQAFAIMSGVFFATLLRKQRLIGCLLLFVWCMHFIVLGTRYTHFRWSRDPLPSEGIIALEGYLTEKDATAGFAEFWDAFAVTFLTQERLRFAGYNDYRYMPYVQEVSTAPLKAFVLTKDYTYIPPESTDIGALIGGIQKRAPNAAILSELLTKEVVSRAHIDYWDVWLLRDK